MSNKLTRSVIKSIVKECLVEILSEGLSGEISADGQDKNQSLVSESRRNFSQRSSRNRSVPSHRRSSALDKISYENSQPDSSTRPNRNFEKNVSNIADQMTSDPVLSSILADTAMTTLQEQAGADRKGQMVVSSAAGDQAARKMAASDPTDMFGEASSKWADLAFAPAINR